VEVGQLVAGRFEIRAAAERGPGLTEYRALDREVEVEVALLVPDPALVDGRARGAAFVAAVDGLRAVNHPHLRRFYGAVHGDDGPVASAQLAGRDPAALGRTAGAPLDNARLIDLAVALGGALGAAHDAGLVHGWLTPFDLVAVAG
jgi:hypothetical protein